MYLQNKYTTWYYNIITNANSRVKHLGYFEKHHIIPKSLGGTDDCSNLVKLTAKEHFICHRLLVKMTIGKARRSMAFAVWIMTAPTTRPRYNPSSITRETLKKQLPEYCRGIELSSIAQKTKIGKYERTAEHRLAASNQRKASVGLQKRSVETKLKMSAWQKGVPKPTVKCQYCEKSTSNLNHLRWHGNNCKLKVN